MKKRFTKEQITPSRSARLTPTHAHPFNVSALFEARASGAAVNIKAAGVADGAVYIKWVSHGNTIIIIAR